MIKNLTDTTLIKNIKEKVKREKFLTVEIINYLEEINQRRLYTAYGIDSLHKTLKMFSCKQCSIGAVTSKSSKLS